MAKTSPARGSMDKQETGGVNKESESYGGFKAEPNVQEWPSYSGEPKRTGSGTKSSGNGSKSGY